MNDKEIEVLLNNPILNDYFDEYSNILEAYNNEEDYSEYVQKIANDSGHSYQEVDTITKKYLSHIEDMRMEIARKAPRCPTCSSTNVHKISELSKAGSVLAFGIFSQKIKRQFHCDNCGYEW